MLDGKSPFNKRPQEKLEWSSLLLTGPGENTWQATQGRQSRVQRECRTRAHALIRVCGWSAGQIGQFKPKEWGFVSSTEVLCRGI